MQPRIIVLLMFACCTSGASVDAGACTADAGWPPPRVVDDGLTPDGGRCLASEIRFWDCTGGLTPCGPATCVAERGDRGCYRPCTSDADCADGGRTHCAKLGFADGEDYLCARVVRVCRDSAAADCP